LGDSDRAGRAFLAVVAGIIVGVTAAVIATYLLVGVLDVGLIPLVAAIMGPIGVWIISRRSRPKTYRKGDLRN
jgi:hypothetical protein